MMQALSERFGRWLSGLALFGCLLLLAMMLIIVADVALRNLTIPGLPLGLSFVGPAFSEWRLLALGAHYEQASQARRPPRYLRRSVPI